MHVCSSHRAATHVFFVGCRWQDEPPPSKLRGITLPEIKRDRLTESIDRQIGLYRGYAWCLLLL